MLFLSLLALDRLQPEIIHMPKQHILGWPALQPISYFTYINSHSA